MCAFWSGGRAAQRDRERRHWLTGCPSFPHAHRPSGSQFGFLWKLHFLFLPLVSLVTSKTNTHSCVIGSQLHFSSRHLGLGTQQDVASRNPNHLSLTPFVPLHSVPHPHRSRLAGALVRGTKDKGPWSSFLHPGTGPPGPYRELCAQVIHPAHE